MKKIFTLFLATLFIASCGNTGNKETSTGSTTNTWTVKTTDTNTSTSTTTWSSTTETPVVKAKVIILEEKDTPLKEMLNAEAGVEATFLSEGEIFEAFQKNMKESTEKGEQITLEPSEEWKKQWVWAIKLFVNEYYPLMVFKASDKENTQIDLETIKKENPEFIYINEIDGETYFAFKNPMFLNGIKRVQFLNAELLKTVESSSFLITWERDENKKDLLLIEDPLCPYCSQEFLGEDFQKNILPKYNIYFLPVALPSHANAPALSALWLKNKDNPKILDLIKATFENQDKLLQADVSKMENVKEILALEGFNFDIPKVEDIFKTDIQQEILSELNIAGTPTSFKKEGNKLILITDKAKELK